MLFQSQVADSHYTVTNVYCTIKKIYNFHFGYYFVYGKMLSSVPDLYPLGASSTLPASDVTTKNISRECKMSPWVTIAPS